MTHVWASIIWSSHQPWWLAPVGTMIHEPIAFMVDFNDRSIIASTLPVLTGTRGRGCLFHGSHTEFWWKAGVSRDMMGHADMIKHEGLTIFLCHMPSLHMSETSCSQCSQSMPWGDFSMWTHSCWYIHGPGTSAVSVYWVYCSCTNSIHLNWIIISDPLVVPCSTINVPYIWFKHSKVVECYWSNLGILLIQDRPLTPFKKNNSVDSLWNRGLYYVILAGVLGDSCIIKIFTYSFLYSEKNNDLLIGNNRDTY